MDRAIVLFTGGKESVFSLITAKSKGYDVSELVFLEKPAFSTHKVNLPAVKLLARILGYELKIIKVGESIEKDQKFTRYLEEQRRKGINILITGNVKLEEHHKIFKSLCDRTGLKLAEPLWGWDTLELLTEYSKIGMQFMIIGIRDESLDPKWLGRIISKENVEEFLTEVLTSNIDPCGEYGEYHSLVTRLSDLKVRLRFDFTVGEKINQVNYLILKNPQVVKESNYE